MPDSEQLALSEECHPANLELILQWLLGPYTMLFGSLEPVGSVSSLA